MVLSLGLCAYIAVRYATLTDEIALIPLSGLIVSALLIVLIMEASRRTNGWGFVSMIAAMAVYVYISPHLSGRFSDALRLAGAHDRLSRPRHQRRDRHRSCRSRSSS